MVSACSFIWFATALLSAVAVRLCMRLAAPLGFVDIPENEAHKRHKKSTPVMGGVGMFAAWITVLAGGWCAISILPADFFANLFGAETGSILAGAHNAAPALRTVIAGTVLLTLAGAIDDRHPLKAWQKFLIQAAVAILTALSGLKISFLHDIPLANTIITVLWFMTVMNAINFFDNMDGLACGAALIASFFFLVIALIRGQFFVAVLASMTAGAATGFAIFNAPPAKIFMGDAGSHFLAYLLAVQGILTTFYIPGKSLTCAPLLIPLFLLAVPLFDALAVIVIRLKLHKPIYKGDNRHISHRFESLGLSRKQAVLLVLLLCMIIGCSGVLLLWLSPVGSAIVMLQTAAVFTLISLIQFYIRKD